MIQDRILYKGLKKEYISKMIISNLSSDIDYAQYDIKEVTPEDQVEKHTNVILKPIVKIAFKYKERIKKIPLIGKLSIKLKDKILAKASSNLNRKVISLNETLSLAPNSFIGALYNQLLERNQDEEGFVSFQRLLGKGARREALIYVVYKSKEFNSRFDIENVHIYKKYYNRFILKQNIKNMPVLGWILKLIKMPSNIEKFHQDFSLYLMNYQSEMERTNNQICVLEDKIDKLKKNAEITNSKLESIYNRTNGIKDRQTSKRGINNERTNSYYRRRSSR